MQADLDGRELALFGSGELPDWSARAVELGQPPETTPDNVFDHMVRQIILRGNL